MLDLPRRLFRALGPFRASAPNGTDAATPTSGRQSEGAERPSKDDREPWVCIGHSHSAAFGRAAKAGDWPLDTINFWQTGNPWLQVEGETRLRPDLADRVAQGRLVLSQIGGSAHTVLGMVEHNRPFDFVLPSDPGLPLDETRELVPAEAVRAKLTELTAPYLEKVPIVIRAAAAVVHIEPPPPIADAERIAPHIPWDMFFPGQPKVVAPKWLRFKLWRMHSEIIAAACAGIGIAYIRAPDSARDSEGFLDPRYDEDGAHANGSYAALILEALRCAR